MAAVTSCEVCARPDAAATHYWRRQIPTQSELALCGDCRARLERTADDRGESAEEFYRVLDLGRHLGGEVWDDGQRALWFRDPIIVRIPPAPPIAPTLEPHAPLNPITEPPKKKLSRARSPQAGAAPSPKRSFAERIKRKRAASRRPKPPAPRITRTVRKPASRKPAGGRPKRRHR